MLPQEARWIGARLDALSAADTPLLNLGSSTAEFVTRAQPWISEHVLAPLHRRGVPVLNVDVKAAPGVDLVGDICDPPFQRRVQAVRAGAILCSNLLEHVRDPAELARALVQITPVGGMLIVTGPRSYPWHPDPLDNGLRPDVAGMAALFPGTALIDGEVVTSGSYWDWLGRSPWALARACGRLLMPFYSPRWWWADALKLGWLARPFSATCVLLQRRAG
jgi:SAM-dependent methyltransferase